MGRTVRWMTTIGFRACDAPLWIRRQYDHSQSPIKAEGNAVMKCSVIPLMSGKQLNSHWDRSFREYMAGSKALRPFRPNKSDRAAGHRRHYRIAGSPAN
jgi:hypothetical protein